MAFRSAALDPHPKKTRIVRPARFFGTLFPSLFAAAASTHAAWTQATSLSQVGVRTRGRAGTHAPAIGSRKRRGARARLPLSVSSFTHRDRAGPGRPPGGWPGRLPSRAQRVFLRVAQKGTRPWSRREKKKSEASFVSLSLPLLTSVFSLVLPPPATASHRLTPPRFPPAT